MNNGLILVISGPAGSGKGTVNRILRETGEYELSVSRTTRAPRPGEVDGTDYRFVTVSKFKQYLEAGDFLEYNEYCGNFYGTPKGLTERILASGKNVILEIDVNGAMQVKRSCPDAVMIMILPPSFAEQEKRLRGRGTETEEKIKSRLQTTYRELEMLDRYDYIVVSREGESHAAAEDIMSIVRAEQLSVRRNPAAAENYFENKNEKI